LFGAALAILSEGRAHQIPQLLRAEGLGQKSNAPALMARTLVGISPFPVRKMIGG
jgi:hypothetical protein